LVKYERQLRSGRKQDSFYCSLSCFGAGDQLSAFRPALQHAKGGAKSKQLDFDLDLEYLKLLWESQRGVCPYLGVEMALAENSCQVKHLPHMASLDRIDSSQGYVRGNVEWVCLFVNLGKNGFTKNQIRELLSQSGIGTA